MIDLPPPQPIQHVTYEVIERVAEVTKTPVLGLYLILQVEGGTVGECNATRDCGPFQVNRQHYSDLKRFGLSEHMIVNTVWGNAYAAGIVLRQKLNYCQNKDYDYLGKIACYHSFTPRYRKIYRNRLYQKALKLNASMQQVAQHGK